MGLFSGADEVKAGADYGVKLYEYLGRHVIEVERVITKETDSGQLFAVEGFLVSSDHNSLREGMKCSVTAFRSPQKKYQELFFQNVKKIVGAILDTDPNDVTEAVLERVTQDLDTDEEHEQPLAGERLLVENIKRVAKQGKNAGQEIIHSTYRAHE